MPMSEPAYMHASIATPGLTGWDYLHMVECPDAHIIFPSWCSSDYSLSRIIQHVNYTQVPNFDKDLIILFIWFFGCPGHDAKLHLVARLHFWSLVKYAVIPSLTLLPDTLLTRVVWPSWLGLQNTPTASLQRSKTPPTSALNMTQNNRKVSFQ